MRIFFIEISPEEVQRHPKKTQRVCSQDLLEAGRHPKPWDTFRRHERAAARATQDVVCQVPMCKTARKL